MSENHQLEEMTDQQLDLSHPYDWWLLQVKPHLDPTAGARYSTLGPRSVAPHTGQPGPIPKGCTNDRATHV